MRWIILALSLGTFVLSMIHSVFMLFGLFPVSSGSMPPWLVGALTIASAVFAMIGGIVAFNRNRMGSVYLMLGALLCIVSPSEFWIYGSLYLIATVLCFGSLLQRTLVTLCLRLAYVDQRCGSAGRPGTAGAQ